MVVDVFSGRMEGLRFGLVAIPWEGGTGLKQATCHFQGKRQPLCHDHHSGHNRAKRISSTLPLATTAS